MSGLLVGLLLAVASAVLTLPSGRLGRVSGADEHPVVRHGIRDAPLMLDLLGAMVAAGASVESALVVVSDACDPALEPAFARVCAARLLGATWESAWESASAASRDAGPHQRRGEPARSWFPSRQRRRTGRTHARTVADVRDGLRFATSTGAPSAALLHAHAAQLRRRRNREIDRKAAVLGVQLVLPLGLCSLPAFICLGVVPVVLGLLPAL
jgi:pilus assembly protein TadC